MPLPAAIPKKAKRTSRWRSQKHRDFVRGHACANCGSMSGVEVAHVRMGSQAGMGEKPDDYRAVSLCVVCHRSGAGSQHTIGELAFWRAYAKRTGESVDQLIDSFIAASPRKSDILRHMAEKAHV